MPRYWLMKTEPGCFSIQDLAKCPRKTTFWDGVRNYQARNFMREMEKGDGILFYHSSIDPPAIAGTATVAREAYPDHTALNPAEGHYDPKSTTDNPIWEMVDIQLDKIFEQPLALDSLRAVKPLAKMELLRKGSRLSVQPVSADEWRTVMQLSQSSPKPEASRQGARTSRSRSTPKPMK